MQGSALYDDQSSFDQHHIRDNRSIQSVTIALPILVVVIVVGSLFWLQWAGQRSITLGYPMPQVSINTLLSNSLTLHQNYQFSARASGRDLTYSWDFGDQSSDYGPAVSHAYQSNGSFTVTVTVVDPVGHRATQSITAAVVPPPPQAAFTYSIEYGGYVYFDASASTADPSTSVASYHWDFGDGSGDSTNYRQDSHSYNSTGTYQVTLTVTDATGQTSAPVAATFNI